MTLKRALELSMRRQEQLTDTGPVRPVKKYPEENKPGHLVLGAAGEEMAVEFLTAEGLKIIDRNVRYRWGEIDIVARDGDEIAFVEVRTRSVGRLLPPDRTVGPDKLRKLVKAARTWTEGKHYEGFWRIDLVAITLDRRSAPVIEHIRDITEGIQ